MLRITFFALFIFSCLYQATSQMRAGVLAGFNLSNINQDFKDPSAEISTKFKPGYSIGFFTEIPFGESNLGLQSGLFFSSRGFSVDVKKHYGSDYEGYDRSSYNYFVLPLNLTFNAVGNLFVYGGPYGAIGFSGVNKYDLKFRGQSDRGEAYNVPVFFESDESNLSANESAFNALDIGANLGIGYEFNDFVFNLSYYHGMMNLTPENVNDPNFNPKDFYVANQVISLNVVYLVNLDH